MENAKKAIGERIKALREENKETQSKVAKFLNVTTEMVCRWEAGERDLKTEYTVKLAEHFKTSCDYILHGKDPENINICQKTGLVNEAINILSWYNKRDDYDVDILNTLILSHNLCHLIEEISRQLKNLSVCEKLKGEETENIIKLLDGEKDIFADKKNAEIEKKILALKEKAELEEYRILKTLRNAVDSTTSEFLDKYKKRIAEEKKLSGITEAD